MKTSKPLIDPFYAAVGRRMETARKLGGEPRKTVSERAGISYQQIQKNEKGQNRTQLKQLYAYSRDYGVPIQDFFPDPDSIDDVMEFFPDEFPQPEAVEEYLGKQKQYVPSREMMQLAARIHCLSRSLPNLAKVMHAVLDTLEAHTDAHEVPDYAKRP